MTLTLLIQSRISCLEEVQVNAMQRSWVCLKPQTMPRKCCVSTTSNSGLYIYLQRLTAATELTSGVPLVALQFHNHCREPLAQ